MTSLRLPAALLVLAAATACTEPTDCTPTRVVAEDATKVDLRAVTRSATIEARLTAANEPLAGRRLSFEVLDDGASIHEANAATGADGTARVDLKRADPATLVALARADEFRASFAGDARYCSASDDGAFGTVRS